MSAVKKTTQKKRQTGPVRASVNNAKRKNAKKKLATSAVKAEGSKESLDLNASLRSSGYTDKHNPAPSPVLTGYVPFTLEVWRTLWRFKSTFISLVLLYSLLSGLFVGLASQNTYSQLGELIRSASSEVVSGNSNQIGEAGLLLMVGLSSGLGANLSDTEQLMVGLLALMVWLVTIWLLRALLAGHKPRLRDGFYNAATPIIPTTLLSMVLILQLIPAAVAMMSISVILPTGLIGGVSAVLFWIVILLLMILSLYWVASTIMALVIVTLPGMYPMQALKTARKLVAGRRLKIILRMVWLFFAALIVWGLTMIPVILFDAWIKGLWQAIDWVPIIPVALLIVGAFSLVWTASYIYLLYRKVVDDDAASA